MDNPVEMRLLPESDRSYGGRYDYGVAGTVKSAFEAAANALEQKSGSRLAYVHAGKEDFKGYFADLFQTNADTAASDASRLAAAMRQVAEYIRQMSQAAREEDDRRRENNEWVRDYLDRNGWEKFTDWFTGVKERTNMDPVPGPTFEQTSNINERHTPEPGSGGGNGGGTSSARPENLRTFAANSRSLDEELNGQLLDLQGQLNDFDMNCYWGGIEASGVIIALSQYRNANEDDAVWATTIADAFAAAGGEGNVSTVSDAALAAALAAAGVDASREALTIDPPRAYGAIPTTGYANDPVNTATGNFIEPETDLGFAGTASNLVLSRMYNSLASDLETPGVFGPGWASILDQHLVLSDEGCRWVLADGRAVDFPREGEDWGRAVGENYWLTREPAAAAVFAELTSLPEGAADLLVVRDNQGGWWAYSLAGIWLGVGSGPGRTLSVHREDVADDDGGAGQVTRLSHVRGRFLDVDYVQGRAAVVRASDGRRAEYGYDDAGRLVSVTTETGTRSYRWNDAGLIDAVYSAAGVLEAENTYDEQGRVILQVTQHGRRTRFAYMPGRVTAVSDEDGTRSNSWIADAKGRLVGVLDSHDQRQSMAYDKHGNLVSLTERDGSVTVHAYDERGRKTRTVTPEGADLTYGWDEQDRITTLVTESGSVVSYEYADELTRDPSVMIDPLGGRTELSWQEGLLTRVTDPVGITVIYEYDKYGDLSAVRNAAGDATSILRDSAGRVIAALSPSGAQTCFTYDAAGLLIRREDPDGATWSFENDSTGRRTASIAPDGGRTELEYAANGELVRTTDPLGRSIERVFDELGNVTAAILPDGARWGFTHDTLSRVTGITDPAGHDWIREYDKIGNLTAVVDPTGVRSEAATDRRAGTATVADAFSSSTYSFDEYGRPVRAEAADGSAELTTYDAAGNPVELIDGEGGLTRLERDVAGKITSVTSPSGSVTRYEYDLCGRPWKTIDPLGAVTELSYDVDQRVVARVLPTGETETFEYDVCGRLIQRVTPGNGNARYAYDKAGRLSFSQDSWYGTRRFKYNVAGELTETVNGVGGRTRFEYDVRGRLIRITDPLGGVTTRTFTETDKVDSVSDPLGRVTTATYDPAGRQLSKTDPDGNTTRWAFDAAGREKSASYNGKLLSSVDRDRMNRRVVITDYTGNDGLAVEHELGFNRRGHLTSRTRGRLGMSWSYDADGNRTGFTDTTGTTTTYTRDASGRVKTVGNPRLGEAVFAHDAAGRLTAVTAGDLVQEWVYRNGYLSEHTRTDHAAGDGPDITLIGRDEDGRITGLTRAGAVTRYGYDGAGQLVAAATKRLGESDVWATARAQVSEWEYDAGGRLIREFTPAGSRTYGYDAAGQLVSVTEADGSRTEYVYDGLGRRSRMIGADGSWTEYAWGETGHLQGTVDRAPDGREISRHELRVDALGELASVDGCPVWWDTANPVPSLTGIAAEQVLSLPGGVAGIGDSWTAQGWRVTRPTDETDPWAVLGLPVISGQGAGPGTGAMPGLPSGLALTGNGGLDIAGLEWLGARAYDPAARSFLSTDPLSPVLGAGWDGNPYAYAGNNPLNASDPTGLRPLTDEQLKDFDKANEGYGDWVLGGLALVGGFGLMFAPFPGAQLLGMGLMSFGGDVLTQKMFTGEVNYAQSAAMGAVGVFGAAGAAAARTVAASASAASRFGGYVAVNAGVNGGFGAVSGAASYVFQHGGIDNWRAFAGATIGGGVSGAAGGMGGPATGSLVNGAVKSVATSTGLGAGANVAGTVTDSLISGEDLTWGNLAWSAGTGGGLAHVPTGGPTQSNTLAQAAMTNPSTWSGLRNWGANAERTVTSAGLGAGIGFGVDQIKSWIIED